MLSDLLTEAGLIALVILGLWLAFETVNALLML